MCVYRVFVDVVNGEPVPRKSILKSRSRENSVCSDTSESSTADFEERRAFVNRSHSHDEATYSDTSDGITEEDSPTAISLYPNGRFEVLETCLAEFAVKNQSQMIIFPVHPDSSMCSLSFRLFPEL